MQEREGDRKLPLFVNQLKIFENESKVGNYADHSRETAQIRRNSYGAMQKKNVM